MKNLTLVSALLLTLFSTAIRAQERYTISGTVSDTASGETLIGALIGIRELPGKGAVSNEYGFYSLTLAPGQYTLFYQFTGFKSLERQINLQSNMKIDVPMASETTLLKAIEITAEGGNNNVTDAKMGVEKLDIKEINKLPVLFGERDILKSIQLLPGVKSAGEGNSGFFVRGGQADHNLILLDEAPVYNASHLLGFFSTFNSDAIKDATLYKGSAPANFGGRASSVLDIRMNEGNNKDYQIGGGIGLISSRLLIEGPIVKDKGSFIVTGRRTYADVFLKASKNETLKKSQLYFYDLNLKANYILNDKNRMFLSAYTGRDVLGVADAFSLDWGNTTVTARWNHIANSKWFSNTSLIFSDYNYTIGINSSALDIDILSRIQDYNIKHEWQFFPNASTNFRFGANAIYHTMIPGEISASEDSGVDDSADLKERYSFEAAVFANGDSKIGTQLKLNYGVRLSTFSPLGGDHYTFDQKGNVLDTTTFAKNELVDTYIIPEPRFTASYILNEAASIKGGYARNAQFLHLISNSTSASPTDLWIPSSKNVKPQIADQISLGYFQNLKNNKYEMSAEVYYKAMQNQIDYRNGASTQGNELIEGELLYGDGRAYGIELLLKKKKGKFNGWLGYTLSRTERQISGINNNDWYPSRQDRTHEISIVGVYDYTEKLSFSAAWIYYTGNAVTFPSGKYEVDGETYLVYTERNGYRMPDYHRLDLSVTYYRKKTAKYESNWNFSIYNAYGRENAFTISFRDNDNDPSRTSAYQTTLFRWVPSVTYNFLFK
jgi:hypothetical protein